MLSKVYALLHSYLYFLEYMRFFPFLCLNCALGALNYCISYRANSFGFNIAMLLKSPEVQPASLIVVFKLQVHAYILTVQSYHLWHLNYECKQICSWKRIIFWNCIKKQTFNLNPSKKMLKMLCLYFFTSEMFTSYILTIFKQWNILL